MKEVASKHLKAVFNFTYVVGTFSCTERAFKIKICLTYYNKTLYNQTDYLLLLCKMLCRNYSEMSYVICNNYLHTHILSSSKSECKAKEISETCISFNSENATSMVYGLE